MANLAKALEHDLQQGRDETDARLTEIAKRVERSPGEVRTAVLLMTKNTDATSTQVLNYMEYLSAPTRVDTLKSYIDVLLQEKEAFDKMYQVMMEE